MKGTVKMKKKQVLMMLYFIKRNIKSPPVIAYINSVIEELKK